MTFLHKNSFIFSQFIFVKCKFKQRSGSRAAREYRMHLKRSAYNCKSTGNRQKRKILMNFVLDPIKIATLQKNACSFCYNFNVKKINKLLGKTQFSVKMQIIHISSLCVRIIMEIATLIFMHNERWKKVQKINIKNS